MGKSISAHPLKMFVKHIVKKPKASEKLHAAIDALEKAAVSDSE